MSARSGQRGYLMQLHTERFDEQFERFKQLIKSASGRDFVGFNEGLAAEWEDYKLPLRQEALSRLDFDHWKFDVIGDGALLDAAIRAVEIEKTAQNSKNNLVRWENIFGHASRSHRAMRDARLDAFAGRNFENWFFRFFRGAEEAGASFEGFRQLAGNRYDLIAYFFYLKDSDRYMPIAPETFDKAFGLLGIDLKTSGRCSWENYSQYNEALTAIGDALRDRAGVKNARLIDAHSFCWMLIRVDSEPVKPKEQAPLAASVKLNSVNVYDGLQKSIWEMAHAAETAAANSGKIVQQISKIKELHISKQVLEEHIGELIKNQEGRCALTGIPLQYRGEHHDELLLASLDRKDSNGHYEKSNLQVVCRFVNFWKGDTPNDKFLWLLALARTTGSGALADD
jgi:hypothetical protein